jgi:hypothetical protein
MEMSFNFPKKSRENKAQWHFGNRAEMNCYSSDEDITSDVLGSYTGTAYDDDFYPVQDADDL